MATTIAQMFITEDKTADGGDVTFNMIEDESGDIYWAYGHVDGDAFGDEVNRWWIHTGTVTDPDDLIQVGHRVEHMWAILNPNDEWRFILANVTADTMGAFPVTRLML